jgi:methylthioribose-1-phosphate isomerase
MNLSNPIHTHANIDTSLCGAPIEVAENVAVVELVALASFVVDDRGLVHGGFVFGALDHAAMLAVNHPNVVLGAADLRFLAPVRVGDRVRCRAEVTSEEGRKRRVVVTATVDESVVASGHLMAFVLDHHVLDRRNP